MPMQMPYGDLFSTKIDRLPNLSNGELGHPTGVVNLCFLGNLKQSTVVKTERLSRLVRELTSWRVPSLWVATASWWEMEGISTQHRMIYIYIV